MVLANRPHSDTWAGKRSSSTALLLLIALRVTLSCCDGFIASLSLWVRGSRAMQSCAQSRTGVSCSLWLWSGVSVANGQCSSIMMLHRPVRESTERSCHSSHTAAWHCPSAGGAKGAVSTDAPTDALTHVWVWEKEFHHHKLWWVKQTGLWIKKIQTAETELRELDVFVLFCLWLIDWLIKLIHLLFSVPTRPTSMTTSSRWFGHWSQEAPPQNWRRSWRRRTPCVEATARHRHWPTGTGAGWLSWPSTTDRLQTWG